MKILFIDPTCPQPYNKIALEKPGIAGGTEKTVIYIAESLSKKHEVYVAQHCRHEDELSEHISYISIHTAKNMADKNFDVVIILRKYQQLAELATLYPGAKIFFWMHDLPVIKMHKYRKDFIKHQCSIICVSNFHKGLTKKILAGKWYHKLIALLHKPESIHVRTIYNPISDQLKPDKTPVDKNKLIFLSSPNKGLNETILLFNKLLGKNFQFYLYVANPGYIALKNCKQLNKELLNNSHIILLGSLSHDDVLQHVRESLCVFYPQKYKAETFGLVYAEANAVGTPVLAHDFGSAKEVLNNDVQLVDATKPDAVINTLLNWYNDRPKVTGKKDFKLTNVIKTWEHLITISK